MFIRRRLLTRLARLSSQVRGVLYSTRSSSAALLSSASPDSNSASHPVKKTCLYDFHVRHGAKMVEFGGWCMPVYYSDLGIPASHLHTRESASIFDVSHMLQTIVRGKDSVEFMESLTVADIAGLKDDQGTLSLLTNESGGIIDDLIISKTSLGYLYVVSNAGCSEKDLQHLRSALKKFQAKGKDVTLEIFNNALIAVQGPAMADVLQPLVDINLSKLGFMNTTEARVLDVNHCRVTRCGYTGEDGVEISMPVDKAEKITQEILNASPNVKMAGLGARDSLRLEAGLCLYGNDIDDKTTPIEASLAWTIAKRRRQEANFPGADVILKQLTSKPSKKRVGIVSSGPPARGGTLILDEDGSTRVGLVTSGCPSPSLKKNVAMGYVDLPSSAVGQRLKLEIRKQLVDCEIVKMPFVPTRYFTAK